MTTMIENRTNWAGNVTFSAARWHHPETIAQVREIVRGGEKVRVLGSRHSFNTVADTTGDLLVLDRLDVAPVFDRERHTLTVGASITYGELGPLLHGAGYALHNTASLPHITVAGACATATHGSGDANRILATGVAAMEFVAADGSLVALSRERDGDTFAGAVVGLGGLGAVTRLTLDLQPTFNMRQTVYQNLPLAQLEARFDAITAAGYSVSLFTDWQGEHVNTVWVKQRVADGEVFDDLPDFFGATAARTAITALGGAGTEKWTAQLGEVGPWHERLHHLRAEFPPGEGEELQSEYFVPRPHAVAAFRVLHGLREEIGPLIHAAEVRTIAADDLWMSPFYGRDCVALHFTWKKNWAGVRELLPLIEEGFAPLEAAPHWGKLFTMPASRVRSHYAKLPDFRRLLRAYDPAGKFRNAFLDTYIFGED